MAVMPPVPRAIAFFDGQNLFHSVRDSFGYNHPNYDPRALALSVCGRQGWQLAECRFYTGVPDKTDNAFWNHFWSSKLLAMSRGGVRVFSRPLRYRNKRVQLPDGSQYTFLVGEEKGIDVRISLDVIGAAVNNTCDVALVFSQDQDLSEVADEIREIAKQQARWIKIASAYPISPVSRNKRGINSTDWIKIDRAEYDRCVDLHDYRPPAAAVTLIPST